MHLYLIGIDYKKSPLAAREELYQERSRLNAWIQQASGQAAVLFTCNRVEIYGRVQTKSEIEQNLYLLRGDFVQFARYGYSVTGFADVARHALRLAVGLESQIKGELQIIQQLEGWIDKDDFPAALKSFWKEIIEVSRKIRFEVDLSKSKHTIATAFFNDVLQLKGNSQRLKVVVVGTGKIAHLIAKEHRPQTEVTFVAHKNFAVAKKLADFSGAKAAGLADVHDILLEADILVSATTSPHFIFSQRDLEEIAVNRNKPLYVYDLAVPRDIDPNAGNTPGIILKNLDDLVLLHEPHNRGLELKLFQAEYLIEAALLYQKESNEQNFAYGHTPQPISV